MSLIGAFMGSGATGFGYSSTAEAVSDGVDLSGKTFLLTGCSSGLGAETLRVLGLRGAHVFALARSEEKAQASLEHSGASGTPVACDLADPDSVRAAVLTVKRAGRSLDGMIANAGIMALPKLQLLHGYEAQFFTNHVGHFILVTGVLDQLADDGRVVIVSSSGHKAAPSGGIAFDNLDGAKGYSSWRAYGQSKLANLLFAKHLATRFDKPKQTANALHPGVIETNLGRHMNAAFRASLSLGQPLFAKNVAEGAATQCFLATNPKGADTNGEYFSNCNVAKTSRHGRDAELAKKLWERTEAIVEKLPRRS
ncbi:MAG: SDR family NAD(P)-dependent oxidoreductase [Nannocystaceae bacterium]|nr:SDR family NAD(P)-dependent oxidoreductase [Nannocystaceae bacterium]